MGRARLITFQTTRTFTKRKLADLRPPVFYQISVQDAPGFQAATIQYSYAN
jgi:hypothetical protein